MTTYHDCGSGPRPPMLYLPSADGLYTSEEIMKHYGVMPIPSPGTNLDEYHWLTAQQRLNIQDRWVTW